MDQLLAIRTFARVVEAGSFTKAADSIQMPKATVTKLVQALEKHVGAKLLQLDPDSVVLRDGRVHGPNSSIGLAEIAHTWYRRPQDLPGDVDPGGLEVTSGYKPRRDSGTFSYAAHAVTVAVDPDLGDVEILDYVIVEDGGVLVNPMIVDGQIFGGLAQGIGTALYEEMPFDAAGQPLASQQVSDLVACSESCSLRCAW